MRRAAVKALLWVTSWRGVVTATLLAVAMVGGVLHGMRAGESRQQEAASTVTRVEAVQAVPRFMYWPNECVEDKTAAFWIEGTNGFWSFEEDAKSSNGRMVRMADSFGKKLPITSICKIGKDFVQRPAFDSKHLYVPAFYGWAVVEGDAEKLVRVDDGEPLIKPKWVLSEGEPWMTQDGYGWLLGPTGLWVPMSEDDHSYVIERITVRYLESARS